MCVCVCVCVCILLCAQDYRAVHLSMITFIDNFFLSYLKSLYILVCTLLLAFHLKTITSLFEWISHNFVMSLFLFNHTTQSPTFPYGTFKMNYYFCFFS